MTKQNTALRTKISRTIVSTESHLVFFRAPLALDIRCGALSRSPGVVGVAEFDTGVDVSLILLLELKELFCFEGMFPLVWGFKIHRD